MATGPELSATISLDTLRAGTALQALTPQLSALLGELAGLAGPLAAVTAGVIAIGEAARFMAAGLREAIQLGTDIARLSERTGMNAGALTILRKEFADSGAGADNVGRAINIMQRALAGISETGESTTRVFAELHLNLTSLRKLAPEEQFDQIRAAIAGIPDAARQADAAMKIFGRGGGEMLPLLKNKNAAQDAKDALGDLPALMAADAPMLERLGTLFGGLGEKFKQFFGGVLDVAGPQLIALLEKINRLDFTQFGQALGIILGGFLKLVNLTVMLERAVNPLVWVISKLGLFKPIDVPLSPSAPGAGGGFDLGGALAGAAREDRGDRLARIGGFIGGGGHADPLAAVARNTGTTVSLLQAIIASAKSNPHRTIPGPPAFQ